MLQMTTALPKHAPATPTNGCTDMTNGLHHTQDISNGLVQHSQLSNHNNWAHHNPSQSSMMHDNDTSNQLQPPQPQLMMQQHFKKVFWAMQQQIQEQHIMLERKSSPSLHFFEQQHGNLSQTVSSSCTKLHN